MNPRLAIIILGLPAAALAAGNEATPAPRPRLTQELRRRVEEAHPSSSERSRTLGPRDLGEEVAVYPVVGGDHGMVGRPDAPTPQSRPFELLDGGTYASRIGAYSTAELALQYDPGNAGWDLLRISW